MYSDSSLALLTALALTCAATPATAQTASADSPRAIMEKRGLLGTWAPNCKGRATPTNEYVVWRPLDDGRVQRDVMQAPTRRAEAGTFEAVVELGPQDLETTRVGRSEKGKEFHDVVTHHFEGDRQRVMERVTNGERHIAGGRFTNLRENRGWVGRPTPWYYKCD